ncbi:Xaa-Pro dipeptidyl-peptidase [Nonomuraea sp. NPDC003804]|uniref:Xaa-Pro dipeptidyl-peptidase n=1 Tax=Nonomuraea sp. NPDC003804 TaxID=3154547 RepID=UPI0033AA8D4C
MRTRRTIAVPLAAVLIAAAGVNPALSDTGPTQPIYSRADAVKQTVFVEVEGVDSDRDGRNDRVAADFLRPKETETGLKVPIIMESSPYYAGIDGTVPNHKVDVDENGNPLPGLRSADTKAAVETFPGYYDNYFVPRGYAVARVESLGSGRSTGCPTTGDAQESAGPKAVIDWLNGRAKGFDAAGNPVTASWSTGNVGMIGVSYNGTLPNQVAATGVEGLKTIVPIAAISSWYDYYRANGGVLAPGGYQGEDADVMAKAVLTRAGKEICAPVMDEFTAAQDRITGDYSDFWAARDFLVNVDKVKASVFLVHGLNDWNVKTKQAAQWWQALAKRDVPRKIWLHQGAHADPFNVRTVEWLRQLHLWFDHWLYGIDTGIMSEPQADVEIAPGQWGQHARWPLPGTLPVRLWLGSSATLGPLPKPLSARESYVDQNTRKAEQLVETAPAADPNRLAYLTGPLPTDVRISGTPTVTVRASLKDGASPYLTALLVDYGTDTRANGRLVNTGEQYCYGEAVPGESGCTFIYRHGTVSAPYKIVSRGWLDVRNRHRADRTDPVRAGKAYTFRWDFQPQDYLFKKGHKIGLVLTSTDYDFTLRYPAGTKVEISPGLSSLELPVVFGRLS